MSDSSGLGKLTSSARKKKLNQIRGILIAIGVITVLLNAFQLVDIRGQIEKEIQNTNPGAVLPEPEMQKAIRIVKIIGSGFVAVGVVFILFGIFVHQFPVPITVLSLVLYVGCALIGVVLTGDMTMLFRGIIIRVLIIVGLVSGIKTAIELEKEQKQEQLDYE